VFQVQRAGKLGMDKIEAASYPRTSHLDQGHRTRLSLKATQQDRADHISAHRAVGAPAGADGRVIVCRISDPQIHELTAGKRIPHKTLGGSQVLRAHRHPHSGATPSGRRVGITRNGLVPHLGQSRCADELTVRT